MVSVASTQDVNVAIVSGGLSGLAAAKDIAKSGKTFTILKVHNHIGGYILNAHLSNREV
jgi:ribulose 1,5-bisphosphate synthetase/thiazole synthase